MTSLTSGALFFPRHQGILITFPHSVYSWSCRICLCAEGDGAEPIAQGEQDCSKAGWRLKAEPGLPPATATVPLGEAMWQFLNSQTGKNPDNCVVQEA